LSDITFGILSFLTSIRGASNSPANIPADKASEKPSPLAKTA